MPMFNKFNSFVRDLGKGVHNLEEDTLKTYLTNELPNPAQHEVKAELAEIIPGSGYLAGGLPLGNSWPVINGRATLEAKEVTFRAEKGKIGPFQYAVVYNSTVETGPLVGYWDYGIETELGPGESILIDPNDALMTLV